MSHHVYHTRACILGGHNVGEAHRSIDILTEEVGRIRAVARSVREEKSKLRFSLQDLSVAHLSLVRGRDVWRIVGAQGDYNIYTDLGGQENSQDTIVRFTSLLRRLVAGEEENKKLFAIVIEAFEFLRKHELSHDELRDFECLVVLRMLYNLGYLAQDSNTDSFVQANHLTHELMSHVSPLRFEMVQKINASLKETQL